MHALTLSVSFRPRSQRGITLIESLVAIVVAALGILGVVGVQMRTLSDTQTTVRRAQAIRLIEDLSERLKVHPNALNAVNPTGGAAASYVAESWGSALTAPSVNCTTAKCTPAQLAAYDLWAWRTLVRNTLPAGDGVVFLTKGEDGAAGNQRQLGIMLRWRENERQIDGTEEDKKKYKNNIDASKLQKADGSFVSGTGKTTLDSGCGDASFTCHLQYIPISARCAPDIWAGSTWHFCAGA